MFLHRSDFRSQCIGPVFTAPWAFFDERDEGRKWRMGAGPGEWQHLNAIIISFYESKEVGLH